MARTHIFDNKDELSEYLWATVMNAVNIIHYDSINGNELDEDMLMGLFDNIKTFAGEYHYLVQENKMEEYKPMNEDEDGNPMSIDELRAKVLETVETIKKRAGVGDDEED